MRYFLAVFLVVALITSCNNRQHFAEFKDLKGKWIKSDTVNFEFIQPDTTKLYNLFFNIRVKQTYPFSNLFLISKIEFPYGKVIQDTLEYRMAKPNGELLGVGATGLKESKLWYKKGVKFSEQGSYKINLRQAMRKRGNTNALDTLKGVQDFGFIIEKTFDNDK
jgi:gliding motility-associated lipoprotein GldH